MNPFLKPEELTVGQQVNYHPEYQHYAWKDGQSPLAVSGVYRMDKKRFCVSYFCSDPKCPRCIRYNPPGHVMILKRGGEHYTQRVEYFEVGKKTIEKISPNPVFEK